MTYINVDIDVNDLDPEVIIEYLKNADPETVGSILDGAEIDMPSDDVRALFDVLESAGVVDMLNHLANKARLMGCEHIVFSAIKELESERA